MKNGLQLTLLLTNVIGTKSGRPCKSEKKIPQNNSL